MISSSPDTTRTRGSKHSDTQTRTGLTSSISGSDTIVTSRASWRRYPRRNVAGRACIRELTAADLPFVAEMVGDAETMRSYPHHFMPTEARYWLQRQLDRYARDGHGLWLVVERNSGRRVGQVGLAIQEVDGAKEPEIGWLIHRDFWRRGYATEAGAAVRDPAFRSLNLGRVISLIRPVNEPSKGVAKKVGMVVERETDFHGYRHLVFAVRRE